MYCMKCKAKTESKDITSVVSKNKRKMLKAYCAICGSKKFIFISNKTGNGIFNDLLSVAGNVVGEMHLPAKQGEYVPNGSFNNLQKYSFCGPGTKYEQRVKEGYKGINELDRMCKLHDKFYNDNPDTASRNISDEALAHRALEISNDIKYDTMQRNMATLVYYIMKNKARFGLGIKSKNTKKGPVKKK